MPSKDSYLCIHCFQPLLYVPIGGYYRLVCDNDSCILFREGQGNVPREYTEPEEKPKGLPSARVLRPDYEPYKERGKEGYAYGRELGLSSHDALKLRNKSKKEIEKAAKELVRV